jgi:hypothetical protein
MPKPNRAIPWALAAGLQIPIRPATIPIIGSKPVPNNKTFIALSDQGLETAFSGIEFKAEPQVLQKPASSGFSFPHFEQNIALTPLFYKMIIM